MVSRRCLLLSATAANSLCFSSTSLGGEDDCWNLRHVSAYFRHGARAPLHGFDLPGVRECDWSTCGESAEKSARIEDGKDDVVKLREVGEESGHPKASVVDEGQRLKVLPGGCRSGELTSVGEKQGRELGKRLRERYGFVRRDELEARTTHVARCVLTMRAVVEGMGLASSSEGPVIVDTVHASKEWLTPPFKQCDRLRELWTDVDRELRPGDLASLRSKVPQNLAEKYRFPHSAVPLKDAMIARASLGVELPWGITDDELEALDAAAAREVALLLGVYDADPARQKELIRLCAGRLVDELKNELLSPRSKFRLVSGHDTTVKPLLVALDAYDHRWPPFCACVLVELYQHKEDPRRQTVRVLYNGLTAPNVADSAREFYVLRNFASIDDFVALLEETSISPTHFSEACRRQRRDPDFSEGRQQPKEDDENLDESNNTATAGGTSF